MFDNCVLGVNDSGDRRVAGPALQDFLRLCTAVVCNASAGQEA
jgi:hypothetical protein